MIYIKRIVGADTTRQIDLNKEAANLFFNFYEGDAPRDLIFEEKNKEKIYNGTIKKTGHTTTITGDISSFLKKNITEGLIVFNTIKNSKHNYGFSLIHSTSESYDKYNSLLESFGEASKTTKHTNESVSTHVIVFPDIIDEPLQQIWYGAPGTGKSHTIKNIIGKINPENVFRTTFHPDTDYASFVGCYKPTKVKKGNDKILSVNELTSILNRYKYDDKISYPETKFGAEYWESLQLLSNKEIKEILVNCSISDSMSVEVKQGMEAGRYCQKMYQNGTITYEFVPQVFTKAYVQAYKNPNENIFLVIEEINRGNCAQIFGDIFQLLDRDADNGFSTYPIEADTDLQQELEERFKSEEYNLASLNIEGVIGDYTSNYGATLSEDVKSGRILLLPPNLYIWATMNTSDQSLFPIDSAFKRRWDWKYVPITKPNEDLNWKIEIGEKEFDWWKFLQKINEDIYSLTESEDKQMGYFFIKAEGEIISTDRFVNKVLFYLYNDVFKSMEKPECFGDKKFTDFFKADREKYLLEVFKKMGLKAEGEESKEETTASTEA